MSRNPFVAVGEEMLKLYGINKSFVSDRQKRPQLIWTLPNGDEDNIELPRNGGDPRWKENFRHDIRRKLKASGLAEIDVSAKHFGDRLKLVEEGQKSLRSQVEAASEIILEAAGNADSLGARLDRFMCMFPGFKSMWEASKEPVTLTAEATIHPMPVKVAKPIDSTPGPKKSLLSLSELKRPNARALAVARNSKLTPEMRVLRFLDENKEAASVEELQRAGLVGHDGRPESMKELLAEMDFKRGLLIFDLEADTYDLSEKAEELLDEADEIAHRAKTGPVSVRSSELEEVEETRNCSPLQAALASVNEASSALQSCKLVNEAVMPAPYSGPPVFHAETPKPTLAIVPSKPRILTPVPAPSQGRRISLKDKILLHLSEFGPKTIGELRAAGLGGYGEQNSLASPMCKARDDKLVATDSRGGKWYLTKKGKEWVDGLLPTKTETTPVHNDDLRRQFSK